MRFGPYIRAIRELKRHHDPLFLARQVAQRMGVEPAYLGKIERENVAPPSEETILKLAAELETDPDTLLAMAGKVSEDVREIIQQRPKLMARLIRSLADTPEAELRKIADRHNG